MKKYDIIIVGGGPAGLSVAARLSKRYSVLVIERQKPGTTHATWYTYEDRVKEHHLEDCVSFKSNYIHFVAPTFQHDMRDNCVVLDHNKVMNKWLNELVVNGSDIVQEKFESYKWINSRKVIIKTNKNEYETPLLIDAAGAPSIIVEQNNLVVRKDAWVIYGARIKVDKPTDFKTQIEYYPLNDDENTYVGVHPYNDKEINFYVFVGKNGTYGDPSELKERFKKCLSDRYPGAEIIQPLFGTIPSGILKKQALDNVIFWGASGMLNPDGCGMGFNEILRQLNTFTAEISRAVKSKRLDRHYLGRVAGSLVDSETMHFQRIIGAFSLYFIRSKGKWDGGVRWLNAMGQDSRFWMRNEMSLDWIRRATIQLHKAVPFRETIRMVPFNELIFIIEQLIRFTFSAAIFGIKKVFSIGGKK